MLSASLRWRALWIALGWSIAAGIVWLSLTPSPPKLDFTMGDKIGHFIGYGTLMFWFCQLYGAWRARAGYALGFAAMGIVLEFIQGAIGYRTYELLDMVANSIGVLLGWTGAQFAGDRWLARLELVLARMHSR